MTSGIALQQWMRVILVGVAIGVGLGGCVGSDDIDRTQPNRLPKAMFDGTWYVQSTIIDVPGTSAAAVQGYPGSMMEKIRWEVQKDLLIAYRAYQEVPGTDNDGVAHARDDAESYKENPVAAFPILSHFDIKREYNPATGEQTNVISENTVDRPWYDRDYIRVDWSSSKIDPIKFSSTKHNAQYVVEQAEDHPDAMRVFDAEGSRIFFDRLQTVAENAAESWHGKIDYFDMVGNFLLEPQTVTYQFEDGSTQDIPLCYFTFYGGKNYRTTTCGPTEVKVRTAYLRVGERNFEPVTHGERERGKFGFIRTERFTLDPHYGATESGRIYLANVHNIWKAAYETNEEGKLKIGKDNHFVRIPLKDRVPKPIAYYLNPDYPCELVAGARMVAARWNQAFRRAVAIAKGLLARTDGDVDGDLAKVSKADVPDMFTVHLNGWVQKNEGDDWSCSNLERDPEQQVTVEGDLRFNHMIYIPDRQVRGPTGVSWLGTDPETGEIVCGRAHVFSHSVSTYTQSATDIVRMLMGDLDVDDMITGDYVRGYIEKQGQQRALDPMIPARAAQLRGIEIRDMFLGDKLERIKQIKEHGFERSVINRKQRALELVADTPVGDKLIDEEIVRALAPRLAPSAADLSSDSLSKETRQQLSPLNWASPDAMAIDRLRIAEANRAGIRLSDFEDESVQGLALDMWKKYGKKKDIDGIRAELYEGIFVDVMTHEVGHSIGLQHNFSSSYDAINFDNHYWKLRQENLIERNPHDKVNGALTFDEIYKQAKMTDKQIKGRMREYQFTSIMDYGAKFNSNLHGLGKYDHAAIAFGYTGFVEVFEKASNAAKAAIAQRFGDKPITSNRRVLHRDIHPCQPRFESRPNLAFTPLLEQWHYSSVWNMLCDDCDKDGKSRAFATRRFRRWADVRGEQDKATTACRTFVDSGQGTTLEFNQQQDHERDLEVPYQFCDDYYIRGSVGCHMWDQGADPYEIVDNVVKGFKSYHFFRNFKRDRVDFSSYSVYASLAGRTFDYLPDVYQKWLFQIGEIDDPTLENYWTIGSFNGFNLLMAEISKPEYGTYCRGENTECSPNAKTWTRINTSTVPTGDNGKLIIGRDAGRRRYGRFEYEGYNFDNKLAEVGHYWTHMAALQALTKSDGVFYGVESGTDFTRFLVPYQILFEDQLTKAFEGTLTESYDNFAPRLTNAGKLIIRPAATLNINVKQDDGSIKQVEIDPATGSELPSATAGLALDLDTSMTLKLYSLLFGMAEFRSLFSLNFADRQLVFRPKSGEEVQAGPNAEVVTCHDPINNIDLATIRELDATDETKGAAVKLVEKCQQQADAYEKVKASAPDSSQYYKARYALEETVQWLNFQRSLYEMLGRNI